MRANRFDQSKLKAFVQSPCFARNRPQGIRIFCGEKRWRGFARMKVLLRRQAGNIPAPLPLGDTLYSGVEGHLESNMTSPAGENFQNYHGTADPWGNGPPNNSTPGGGYIDDGSDPSINSGSFLAQYPVPSSGPGISAETSGVDPTGIWHQVVILSDIEYQQDLYATDVNHLPIGPVIGRDHYIFSSPYSKTDALAAAIAVARAGGPIDGGQGTSGGYQEEGAGTASQPQPLWPYVRSSMAAGASQWWAGWAGIPPLDTSAPPWDGHQTHIKYKPADDSTVINLSGARLGGGNPHQAFLVSVAHALINEESAASVMASTFSGSGALATYENPPLPKGAFWPTRVSCVDLVASSLALNPTLPTLAGSTARWQIFFPGKKASDIPLPSAIWD